MVDVTSGLWRIRQHDFLSWLKSGVEYLSIQPDAMTAEDDVFVQLPKKYERVLQTGTTACALIDELGLVTFLSVAMTDEFRVRLKNLNEVWLPIHFLEIASPGQVKSICLQADQGVNTALLDSAEESLAIPSDRHIREDSGTDGATSVSERQTTPNDTADVIAEAPATYPKKKRNSPRNSSRSSSKHKSGASVSAQSVDQSTLFGEPHTSAEVKDKEG